MILHESNIQIDKKVSCVDFELLRNGAQGRTKFTRSKFEHLRLLQMTRRANHTDVICNLTGVPVRILTMEITGISEITYRSNMVPRAGLNLPGANLNICVYCR